MTPMSKPMMSYMRFRSATDYFGRCWRALHKTSSRRTTELMMAAIMLCCVVRLLQAQRTLPQFPFVWLHPNAKHVADLIFAGNDFFTSLWQPFPHFWGISLTLGVLATLAGMQQTIAVICTVKAGLSINHVTLTGEDDPYFLTSVESGWLLWDIRLRRFGMSAGMAFFATAAWYMLWQIGFPSFFFMVFLAGCTAVDGRLLKTSRKLTELMDSQHEAERSALKAMIGATPSR